MRILVCGSRHWDDLPIIERVLSFLGPNDTLISGAAKGADTLAAFAATELGATLEEYPADWAVYGKAAGPIRNRRMLEADPDLCIAFGTGAGTDGMVRMTVAKGVPTYRVLKESNG